MHTIIDEILNETSKRVAAINIPKNAAIKEKITIIGM
jgi:hypothetical protein